MYIILYIDYNIHQKRIGQSVFVMFRENLFFPRFLSLTLDNGVSISLLCLEIGCNAWITVPNGEIE